MAHACAEYAQADGHSYERAAITDWLRDNDTSPKTGAVLPNKTLIANHTLRACIEEYKSNTAPLPPPPVPPPAVTPSAAPGTEGDPIVL